eukprot:2888947-Rhodomonas_salina.3
MHASLARGMVMAGLGVGAQAEGSGARAAGLVAVQPECLVLDAHPLLPLCLRRALRVASGVYYD